MPHISVYVDESGDIGFTDKTSQFFTIGYVFTVDRSSIKDSRAIQRALKNINAQSKKKISEFKFSTDSDKVEGSS